MEYPLEKKEGWETLLMIRRRLKHRRSDGPYHNAVGDIVYDPPPAQALAKYEHTEYSGPSPRQRAENLSDKSRAYFGLSVLHGWKNPNEYHTKLEEALLCAASMILPPGLGLRYLEGQWSSPTQFP
ncbi:hypothetical protein NUW58_g8457 [Xylaria curta]|uniref:Uncharacterized protein n=1 Tax=Xylaria curta TaxID=42375 RepID=A0ACC1N9G1_9PEZI|nr:hypothetical protein NUW58_g8457 [Xylaria curta]